MFKQIILLIVLLISLLSFSQKEDKVTIINYRDFKEVVKEKDIQLIDLRTDKEYENGFIEDAIQIDFFKKEEFVNKISSLEKEKPIYIYCHSGGRSRRASRLLLNEGFTEIYDFSEGYKVWLDKESRGN